MSRRSERREIDKAARAAARDKPADAVVPGSSGGSSGRAPASSSGTTLAPRATRTGRGEQRADDAGMRVWRWPVLVLIPVLLLAAVFVDQQVEPADDELTTAPAAAPLLPVVADPSAPGSTWYCAAGTATGTGAAPADDDNDASDDALAPGAAEQTLLITNASDADRQGAVTVFAEGPDNAPVTAPLQVPARSRQVVRVSDIVTAAHAAALVEVDGGGVTVQHRLVGPAGRSISMCATAPSDSWVFPVGTTRPGATLTLTLFNPFPGEAVVDITALSDDGTREPEAYQGLVVPAQGLVTLAIDQVITLRSTVTTVVQARSGRVIGELVQTSDGSIVADDEGEPDQAYLPTVAAGLTAMLGAPGPASAWVYPNGATADGFAERFVVYNPGEEIAEVEVQVILDDPATNGVAEPFQVSIEPGSFRAVQLYDEADTRVPGGVGHSVVVRSTNDVPVVSARAIWSRATEDPTGLSFTLGSPVIATRWSSATAGLEAQTAASLTIFNPSPDTPATATVRVVGSGRDEPIGDAGTVTIGPNERRVIAVPVDSWGVPGSAIAVVADHPVVTEIHYRLGDDGLGLSFFVLAPQAGTASRVPSDTGILSTEVLLGN